MKNWIVIEDGADQPEGWFCTRALAREYARRCNSHPSAANVRAYNRVGNGYRNATGVFRVLSAEEWSEVKLEQEIEASMRSPW